MAMTTSPPHFSWEQWIPASGHLAQGVAAAVIILLAGLLLYLPIRRHLRRFKLRSAFFAALIAVAIYIALHLLEPSRMRDPSDEATFWISRLFYAAMVYVGVRLFDRAILVPILSRGGRAPVQRVVHQLFLLVLLLFAVMGYGSWAFGWNINKFLAGSAVVSIVLGLALQESLGNFFSGLVMQASPPFAPGDWITCAGVEGRVVEMNWRAVTLHTDEDNHVVLPNATVAREQIINLHNPTRRTVRKVRIGLEYDLPPCDAVETLKAAAKETEGILQQPEPKVFLENYADSAIVYCVWFWIDRPEMNQETESAVRVNIWYRLKQKGYSIPFPMRTVEHIDLQRKTSALQESAAERRLAAIERIALFQPLTTQQRRQLAAQTRECFLAPGQTLFHQDDAGESFFIITRGHVDVVVRRGDGQETRVATLGPDDFFGEMSALTGDPRSATIRAATAMACVEIDKQTLASLFEADPAIMEKISEIVVRRRIHREQVIRDADAEHGQAVLTQRRTLLGRMTRFFGRKPQPAASG